MNWKRIGWLIVVSGLVGSWGWQDLKAQAVARQVNMTVTYWVKGTDSDKTTPTKRKFKTVGKQLTVGDKVPDLPGMDHFKLETVQVVHDGRPIDVTYVGTQAAGVHIDYVDIDKLNDLKKEELVSHVATKITPLTLGGHPVIKVPKGHQLVHPEDQERVLLKTQENWTIYVEHVSSTPSGHPKPLPEQPGQQLPSPSPQQPPHQNQSSHSETGQTDQSAITPNPTPLPSEKPIPFPSPNEKPAVGQHSHQSQPGSTGTGPTTERPVNPATPATPTETGPTTVERPAQPVAPVVPAPMVTPSTDDQLNKPGLTQPTESIQPATPHRIHPVPQLKPNQLDHVIELSGFNPDHPQVADTKTTTATVRLRAPHRMAHHQSKPVRHHLAATKKKLPQTGESQRKWGLVGLLVLVGILPGRWIYRRFR